ncbi:hypothetical protein C8Q78DRAFT_972604 [Trametes maxima]|nr:hypothetical protein C8Q78DRAFT_972604 [Trametes maxima]
MHSQPSVVSHDGENGTEEFVQTTTHNASQSTVASPQAHRQYATSTESTPLPLPHTPSTTISHPYRSNETATSAGHRSRATAARGSSAPPRSAEPHRRPRHQTEHKEVTTFDEHACLTREQMARAAPLTVVAQNGLRVPFGELVKERKTIVCFIRNFWCVPCGCAMDQDYMYSIARHVDYQSLQHSKTDFIVIGNGSPGMISSYRRIFRTPIPVYTDPSLRLHTALGMTLRTSDTGPDHEKGEYIRHGPIGGLAMVVRNALRVGMPVWEKGGSSTQLGGEFVFGPGLNCSYAHRMTNTRSHAPILEVLMSAGHHFSIPTATNGAPTLSPEEEEAWMEERRRSLARMRAKREKRRINGPGFGTYGPALDYTHGSDTDSGSVSPHGSWASSEEKREMDRLARRARERQKERKRKAAAQKMDAVVKERHGSKVLGLHLSNPDDQYDQYDRRDRDRDHDQDDELEHRRKHHNSTRVHVAHHDSPDWSDAKPTLAYINELGRREDGYETGEESMPDYSYRRD